MTVPIIFVRYAPGSCGTFVLTLLSTSHKVACWNPDLDPFKGTAEFDTKFLAWFKQKYTSDLKNHHIKYEPLRPYQLDFFSSKHPRGNDIDTDTLIDNLKVRNDHLFLDNINKNKLTAIVLNKPVVPKFGAGNSVVNIFADPNSLKWLHRTRWHKLFGHEDGYWILKEHHPDLIKSKYQQLKFNNSYQVKSSWYSFCKNYIINEDVMKVFKNREEIIKDPSNKSCNQYWIDLSEILNPTVAIDAFKRIFSQMDLEFNESLINECYQHYYKTSIQPILQKSTL